MSHWKVLGPTTKGFKNFFFFFKDKSICHKSNVTQSIFMQSKANLNSVFLFLDCRCLTMVKGNSKAPFPIATTGIVGRLFTNGPGDQGSILGQVILKTKKKWYLIPPLLNTQYYKVHINDKVEQSRERSSTLPYTQCSSYWKRSLWVTLDYSHQLYFYTL